MSKDDIFGLISTIFWVAAFGYLVWKYGLLELQRRFQDAFEMVVRRIIYGPPDKPESKPVIEPHNQCKHEETEPVETVTGEVIGHMCIECFKLLKRPRFKILKNG